MEDKPRGRGRGRGRGRQSDSVAAAPAPVPQVQPPSRSAVPPRPSGDQLASKMEALNLESGARGGSHGLRKRRLHFIEPELMNNVEKSTRNGKTGQPMNVTTNLMRFRKLPTEATIHMYDLNFSKDGKINVRTVVDRYNMLKDFQQRGVLPKGGLCYDSRLLFTTFEIPENLLEMAVADNKYGTFNMFFRKIITIQPHTDEWYRVINVVFGMCQQLLGQKKSGIDYFMPPSTDIRCVKYSGNERKEYEPGRHNLEGKFEVLGGYSTALQRVIMNNVTMPLMHISSVHRLANLRSVLNVFQEAQNNPRAKGDMDLIRRSVLTRYNNKSYTVSDVETNCDIDDRFPLSDGRTISQREYFMERYGLQLTAKKQPFVIVKIKPDRQKIYRMKKEGKSKEEIEAERNTTVRIPSEICFLTGFNDREKTEYQRNKTFAQICRKDAQQRGKDVLLFSTWLRSARVTQSLLQDWNIDIDERPHTVTARKLPTVYLPNQSYQGNPSINTRSIKVLNPTRAAVNVALVSNEKGLTNLQNIRNGFGKCSNEIGYNCNFLVQERDRNKDNIPQIVNHMKSQGAHIIVVIMGFKDDYKELKTVCIESGMNSQVVKKRTAEDGRTHQKIMIQIAAKCGLIPWQIQMQAFPTERFMVIGVDTFHAGGRSVAGCVFGLNNECSKYYTTFHSFEGQRNEYNTAMATDLTQALRKYAESNKGMPSKIFLYRDGVSDSQLENVEQQEMVSFKEKLAEIYGNNPYQLVVTIVKKRISQRFFASDNRGFSNVPAGTVVDEGMSKPKWLEYYMVPQESRQGTATPTNYNVIYNNDPSAMNIDKLQQMTFALTHVYYNWCGTIRVPAPVQYAHKVAFLMGQLSNRVVVNESIREKLFYL